MRLIGYATRPVLMVATGLGFATRPRRSIFYTTKNFNLYSNRSTIGTSVNITNHCPIYRAIDIGAKRNVQLKT